MGKITDEDAKKIAQINAEQQKFNQTVAQTSNEFSDFQKSFNGVTEDIKKEVISNAAKQLGEFTNEAKKGGEQIKSLKTELRELKAQIASGTLGDKEMKAATMRAAELTDNLGDVQQKIKALSSDTKRIDAVVEAFRGVAAGVSVVTGAMGLLGSENKELEKTLLKVQSAMAILQGVQELANLATGEGILKNTLLSASELLAGKSATIMGVEITAATAAATAGVSLLLAGLAYLISNMGDTGESAEKMAERLTNSLAFAQDYTDKQVQLIGDGRKRELAENQVANSRELNKLKRALDDKTLTLQEYNKYLTIQTELFKKDEADINKKYDDEIAKKNKDKNDKLIAQEKKKLEDIKKKVEELAKIRLDADNKLQQEAKNIADDEELRLAKTEEEKLLILKSRKASELKLLSETGNQTTENKNALDSALLNLENRFNADVANLRKKNADDKEKENQDDWEAAQKWMNDEIAMVAKTEEEKTKIRKAEAEKQQKLQEQLTQAIFSASQTTLNTLFTLTQQNIQARESEEIASIERKRNAELSSKDTTEAQKAKIQERADRQIAIAKRNAWKAQQNADLAQAVLNGALAVTNALATVKPFPAAIIAAGLAGIQTAAQVAIIKNTPVPKFAKGVEKLNGMGTETSDSILAMLSKNERVVPADVNNDYFPALSAIHNRKVDHTLANSVLTDLANGTFNVTQEQNVTTTIDYNRLEQALTKGKSKVVINLDEKGFSHYQTKSAGTTSYLNKKFKYEI
jgi:hypothetical protein